jgi:hypothetical protein
MYGTALHDFSCQRIQDQQVVFTVSDLLRGALRMLVLAEFGEVSQCPSGISGFYGVQKGVLVFIQFFT